MTKKLLPIARKYTDGQIWEDFLNGTEGTTLVEKSLDRSLNLLRNGTCHVKKSDEVKMVKYNEGKDQNLRLLYTFLSIPRITNILNITDIKNYGSQIIFVECIQTIRSSSDISNFTKSKFFTSRQLH